jgi:hypothetical protein
MLNQRKGTNMDLQKKLKKLLTKEEHLICEKMGQTLSVMPLDGDIIYNGATEDETTGLVLFYSTIQYGVPKERITEVYTLLCLLNSKLESGCSIYYPEEENLVCNCLFMCTIDKLTKDTAMLGIGTSAGYMQFLSRLVKQVAQGESAELVYKEAYAELDNEPPFNRRKRARMKSQQF